jgi:hypothetical protein
LRKPYSLKNRNGRPVVRPDAARNARPKRVNVVHGATSAALQSGELDGRTLLGRHEKRTYDRLVRARGGRKRITPHVELLCRALARMEVVSVVARNSIVGAASVGDGLTTSGATDALLRAVRELRDLLTHPALASLPMSANIDVASMTDEELEYLARGVVPAYREPRPAPPKPQRPRRVLLLPPPNDSTDGHYDDL